MNGLFVVNGQQVAVDFDANATLLEVLRKAGFTEVKHGCGQGECGACLVLLDDKLANSCQVFAATAVGKRITTSAGLGTRLEPSPIHEAFVDTGAVQCGFCTPGMVLATHALLQRDPDPTDEQIREALSGNLCRCTGYTKTFGAVKEAARRLRAQRDGGDDSRAPRRRRRR
jgi:aerobic-type carbon monoxide dehydrogenase small subunit (CoxS/CutS family)